MGRIGRKKKCRLCGGEEETWKHVWERCVGWEGLWQDRVAEVLGEEGKEEGWMRELEELRRENGRSVE